MEWRLYGSDGRGVALLFDVSDPKRESLLIELGSHPRKVVYGNENGQELIKAILNEKLEKVRSLTRDAMNIVLSPEDKARLILNSLQAQSLSSRT